MAYTKTVWKNRQVEKPRTYTMTDNGDGTITLDRAPGEVYEAGTAMNADNMNHLEEGIEAAHNNQKNHEDAENPHKGSASLTHASRHRTDGEDPLTIEMLGAAPSGYGFGGSAITLSSILINNDAELETALEAIYSNMKGGETKLIRFAGFPSNSDFSWFGFLFKSSVNYCSLVAYSAFARGSSITKAKYSGTWQPLEWEMAPLELGKEYRTTERYQGNPVYVKLIDAGILPNNSTKYVESAIVNGITKVVDVKLNMYSGSGMAQRTNDSRIIVTVNVESPFAWLAITANEDFSTYTGQVVVKYIK